MPPGISEAAVLSSLPPWGSIRQYVEYSSAVCDAPLAYHLFSGLSAFSALIRPQVVLPFGADDVRANLFTLLVGDSGDRKTAAGVIALNLLREVNPDLIGLENHESTASLIESLSDKGTQVIFHGEFGEFLAATGKGSYKAALREYYMKIADGLPLDRGKKGWKVQVLAPDLTVLACVAPTLLEEHLTPKEFTGGFVSRFLIAAAGRERFLIPGSSGRAAQRQAVSDRWTQLMLSPQVSPGLTPGSSVYTPGAWKMLEEWMNGIDLAQRTAGKHTWTSGLYARLPRIALKTALLYAFDFGYGAWSAANGGAPWLVGEYELHCGIQVANLHLTSSLSVLERLALTPYERQIRSVMDAVGSSGLRGLGDIVSRCKPALPKKTVIDVLETLQLAKRVFKYGEGSLVMWSCEEGLDRWAEGASGGGSVVAVLGAQGGQGGQEG